MFNRRMGKVFGLSLLIAAVVMVGSMATAAEPIKIGQVSALSGQSAKSGEAIMRGLTLAIEEINAKGGVLGGRKFTLISRDDESNPPKGQMAARELIFKEKVTAFFGGIDSPVSLAIVPVSNKEKVIFMGVWAAATPRTQGRRSMGQCQGDVRLCRHACSQGGAPDGNRPDAEHQPAIG